MKKWEQMEESKDCQIAELEREYRQAITEYEADLNAANGRLHLAQEELRLANESWASKSRELTDARFELAATETALADAYSELDDTKTELNLLRAQLQRVRVAEEPLHRALYPNVPVPAAGGRGGSGGGWLPLTGPQWGAVTFNGVSMQDRVDRLNEAGYSCATGKAKAEAEQHQGYSGLVA